MINQQSTRGPAVWLVIFIFLVNTFLPSGQLYAQSAVPLTNLPVSGAAVPLNGGIFQPALIKGLTLYPDNPFEFGINVSIIANPNQFPKKSATRPWFPLPT